MYNGGVINKTMYSDRVYDNYLALPKNISGFFIVVIFIATAVLRFISKYGGFLTITPKCSSKLARRSSNLARRFSNLAQRFSNLAQRFSNLARCSPNLARCLAKYTPAFSKIT